MRKRRLTEARIIGTIKEQEAGIPTAEWCRRHGRSSKPRASEGGRCRHAGENQPRLVEQGDGALCDHVRAGGRHHPARYRSGQTEMVFTYRPNAFCEACDLIFTRKSIFTTYANK
ncbi:hypothetical protein FQ320_23790 [Oceaniovalibus sp. ACAM 378]|nr:hypothetical protein FQ320_23790 [Oceaniovalibus sp. ACAM 378]